MSLESCFNINCEYFTTDVKCNCGVMEESEPPSENCSDFISINSFSDGYHTFEELYQFRLQYNAALFNEWAKNKKYNVHKSTRHHDGTECCNGEMFIVVAMLPTGQITNHYHMEEWHQFSIPEYEKALYQFDGHTPKDVLKRIKNLNTVED